MDVHDFHVKRLCIIDCTLTQLHGQSYNYYTCFQKICYICFLNYRSYVRHSMWEKTYLQFSKVFLLWNMHELIYLVVAIAFNRLCGRKKNDASFNCKSLQNTIKDVGGLWWISENAMLWMFVLFCRHRYESVTDFSLWFLWKLSFQDRKHVFY